MGRSTRGTLTQQKTKITPEQEGKVTDSKTTHNTCMQRPHSLLARSHHQEVALYH